MKIKISKIIPARLNKPENIRHHFHTCKLVSEISTNKKKYKTQKPRFEISNSTCDGFKTRWIRLRLSCCLHFIFFCIKKLFTTFRHQSWFLCHFFFLAYTTELSDFLCDVDWAELSSRNDWSNFQLFSMSLKFLLPLPSLPFLVDAHFFDDVMVMWRW